MPGSHGKVSGFLKGFFEPRFRGVWSLPGSASRRISVHVPSGRDLEVTERQGGWPKKATSTGGGGLSTLTLPSNCPQVPRHKGTCRAGPHCLLVLCPGDGCPSAVTAARGTSPSLGRGTTGLLGLCGRGHPSCTPVAASEKKQTGLNQRHSQKHSTQARPDPCSHPAGQPLTRGIAMGSTLPASLPANCFPASL